MGAESYRDRLRSAERRFARETSPSDRLDEILRQEEILRSGDWPKANGFSEYIPPGTGGSEHDVLRSGLHILKRLRTKLRWGRADWTPLDYLDSIALFNRIAPAVQIDVIGVSDDIHGVSVVTRMPFVHGKHLSDAMTHRRLLGMGFEQHGDRSGTLDYVHRGAGIIIRDAHAKNFVASSADGFLPVDLQVERLR
jgi:hypothetical protein